MLPTAPPADGAMTSMWLFGASFSPNCSPTTGLNLPYVIVRAISEQHFDHELLLGYVKISLGLTASINENSSAWIAVISSGVQTDKNTPLHHANQIDP